MSGFLLDVNVLVALAWPSHVHHQQASRWFVDVGAADWATTPITELGFVRVSSNAAAIPEAVRPQEAVQLLEQVRELDGHRFLADDLELVCGDEASIVEEIAEHGLVTDLHLLALSMRHDVRLATFDRGAARIAEARSIPVELISLR